jgi:Acetyltransferases, including N-acetylases of ribosomal proteins
MKTERLIIRELKIEDALDMYEYTNKPEVSKFLTWEPHLNVEQDREFINKVLSNKDKESYYFGIVLAADLQKLIGCIHIYDVNERHKRCEISYILNPDYSGKGYATEAVAAVIKWIFMTLGLRRVQALCIEGNVKSECLMKRCGMQYEGLLKNYAVLKDGKSYSMKIYSICRGGTDQL